MTTSSMLIKVCGITNIEDAAAAVEGGATAIGFNFYRLGKRYISPEDAAPIAATLPPAITKVGVFVNAAPSEVERIARLVPLDVVQLHGDESPGDVPSNLRIWKAFRVDAAFTPSAMDAFPQAEAFVLDGPAGEQYGGSGKPFLWTVAADSSRPIIIAGGLDASNVQRAVSQAKPWGVDACSRLEIAPGRKDRIKMLEFLRAALAAEEFA